MPFDLSEVREDIRSQLSGAEKRAVKQIDIALGLCLDDLAMRMQGKATITNYTVSVAKSTRTVTLSGNNDDLQYLWILKWSTGDNQKVLNYVAPKRFMEDGYDNPGASANIPSYYTIMDSDDGMPTIKFNCPTSAADTLTVYYHRELTPQGIARLRHKTPIVLGTLAYFHGKGTEGGEALYAQYREAVKLARESDPFLDKGPRMFQRKEFDREAADLVAAQRHRRS